MFATKLHNFTKFKMLFPAALMNIPTLKVCLKGEWSITNALLPIFHSCLAIEINFVKFVCFISLASVQIYIQVVLLCDCSNNIRKQVYMAFEQGLFNSISSKDKFILQRDHLFNLTRTLTKFSFFGHFCFTHKCSI